MCYGSTVIECILYSQRLMKWVWSHWSWWRKSRFVIARLFQFFLPFHSTFSHLSPSLFCIPPFMCWVDRKIREKSQISKYVTINKHLNIQSRSIAKHSHRVRYQIMNAESNLFRFNMKSMDGSVLHVFFQCLVLCAIDYKSIRVRGWMRCSAIPQ